MPRITIVTVLLMIAGLLCGTSAAAMPPAAPSTPPAAKPSEEPKPPAVGEQATAFKLNTLDDPAQAIVLDDLRASGPVVLVVLRGWPGYQCPICTRQVQGLLKEAETFKKANATVVLVYPGPSDELQAHAKEFISESDLPEHFKFVIDPDYTFTNAWHLRWDAPKETAYPSAFVVDRDNTIRYAKVSKTHGGRAATEEVVKAVAALPAK